ncbi:MAG: hypothetical protein IKO76_08225 [Butyrivibrio sp.]|nr:hypothetical protein [Butyrivibrio sp.]
MRDVFDMFDYEEMRYVENVLFEKDLMAEKTTDMDIAVIEEELLRFVDNLVTEERRIA